MSKTSKVQVNINSDLKADAEEIIRQAGLTPTAVINSLYSQIVATGSVPLSFSFTPRQKANLKLIKASKLVPIKRIKTRKDFEEFFSED